MSFECYICRYWDAGLPDMYIHQDEEIGGHDEKGAYCKYCKDGLDEAQRIEETERISTAAREMGRRGGRRGGIARAASLSPERRSEIAKKAAKTRWAKQHCAAERGDEGAE